MDIPRTRHRGRLAAPSPIAWQGELASAHEVTQQAAAVVAPSAQQRCAANLFDMPDQSLLAVVVLTGEASKTELRVQDTAPTPQPYHHHH
eukprot:COSAG06_NODE_19470_length_836_cov_3.143826_2_plen_90_part_00